MSNFANRDSFLGPKTKAVDAMSRTTGFDNYGVVGLQRQIMKGNLYTLKTSPAIGFSVSFVCYLLALLLMQNKMRGLRN